jgi:hypothetical protein
MNTLTDLLALALWLTPCSYDYTWNWGQQHTLLNHDKQLRYSVTVYPAGQMVVEVKRGGVTYFQVVME